MRPSLVLPASGLLLLLAGCEAPLPAGAYPGRYPPGPLYPAPLPYGLPPPVPHGGIMPPAGPYAAPPYGTPPYGGTPSYGAPSYGAPEAWRPEAPQDQPPRDNAPQDWPAYPRPLPEGPPPGWRPEERPYEELRGEETPQGGYGGGSHAAQPGWNQPDPSAMPPAGGQAAPGYGAGFPGQAIPPEGMAARPDLPPYLGGRWSRDEDGPASPPQRAPDLGPPTWR